MDSRRSDHFEVEVMAFLKAKWIVPKEYKRYKNS